MTRTLDLIKLFFSRRWIMATVIVLILMGVFARLGVWQLDRLAQRRAENAQLRAVLDGPPLQLPAETVPADVTQWENRLVEAQGTFDLSWQGFLILQNWQSRSGVHILTPLRLAGSDRAVLVDRGWIPDAEVANVAAYDQTGPVTVDGTVALPQTLSRAPDASPMRGEDEYYRVDVAAISEQLPYELLPFYVVQSPVPGEAANLPFRPARQVDLSEGPHLSYAIQWFIFCALAGILYVVYVRRAVSS